MELYCTAAAFAIGLILAVWQGSAGIFAYANRQVRLIVRSPVGGGFGIGLFAFIIYALPSLLIRVPSPVIHDEFAYLLAGDTFSHGRLSNPSHPMARFFETFHVIQTPSYAAKFPPGPGLMLAVGYLFGLPIVGVWLSLALAAAALYWMLKAIVPPRWAALVAVLASVHPTVIWFSQTYWGGGLCMLGGALLGGAMLRIVITQSSPRRMASLGLIAGAGMGILALTRPFEGVLLSAACIVTLLIIATRRHELWLFLTRFIPASSLFPAIALAWLLYYDWRVTGQALLMPYALHTARYMVAPLFFWQHVWPTPVYPNEQMQQFHTVTEFSEYQNAVGFSGYLLGVLNRGGMVLWAYFRPLPLLLPLGAALIAARKTARGGAVLCCASVCSAVLVIHLLSCPWMRIAYMAPLYGLLIAIAAVGLRQLDAWRANGQSVGRPLVRAIVFTQLLMGGYALIQSVHSNGMMAISRRDSILDDLHHQGGEHLILVKYAPKYSPMQEWVYNSAEIDRSPVVFARDLGEANDLSLIEYYSNRTTWILEVDRSGGVLRKMPAGFARSNPSNSPSAFSSLTPDP